MKFEMTISTPLPHSLVAFLPFTVQRKVDIFPIPEAGQNSDLNTSGLFVRFLTDVCVCRSRCLTTFLWMSNTCRDTPSKHKVRLVLSEGLCCLAC